MNRCSTCMLYKLCYMHINKVPEVSQSYWSIRLVIVFSSISSLHGWHLLINRTSWYSGSYTLSWSLADGEYTFFLCMNKYIIKSPINNSMTVNRMPWQPRWWRQLHQIDSHQIGWRNCKKQLYKWFKVYRSIITLSNDYTCHCRGSLLGFGPTLL